MHAFPVSQSSSFFARVIMEKSLNLLCDEDFLQTDNDDDCGFSFSCNETDLWGSVDKDDEFVFRSLIEKEVHHLPEKGYSDFLRENEFVAISRSRAVSWILRTQMRMNLSAGTAFAATNYLDRFISITKCQDWQHWTFELLALACLTVASKLSETTAHPLQDFQLEGLENAFAPTLIQRMELTLLKKLGWRVDSVTPISYIHLVLKSIFNGTHIDEFMKEVTRLFLNILSDSMFQEFRPCVVTISAIGCTFSNMFPTRNNASLEKLGAIIPQNLKADLIRCQRIMEEKKLTGQDKHENGLVLGRFTPMSPVTVLTKEMFEFDFECKATGFSPVKMPKDGTSSPRTSSKRKRKRKEEEQNTIDICTDVL